jgi:RES domain-containing protein
MIEARIPARVKIDHLTVDELPADWREVRTRDQLRGIGSEWARKRTAAVLAVPSVVIPAELNYLLNPLHPDFRRIIAGKPQRFETDLRLR